MQSNYYRNGNLIHKFRNIVKYTFKNKYTKKPYLYCNYEKYTKIQNLYRLKHIFKNEKLQFKRYKSNNPFKILYIYDL